MQTAKALRHELQEVLEEEKKQRCSVIVYVKLAFPVFVAGHHATIVGIDERTSAIGAASRRARAQAGSHQCARNYDDDCDDYDDDDDDCDDYDDDGSGG